MIGSSIRLRPALLVLALSAAGLGGALAQDQAAGDGKAQAPGWITSCGSASRNDAMNCQMDQRAVLTNTGQLVSSVTIRVPADTRKPVMMIRGPLGVTLAAGVTLDVDGTNTQALPLQTCDNGGCYAGSPVSDDLLGAMFKGDKLNLTFRNMSNEPIKLPMSLAGFSAAYGKIK